MIFIYFYFFGFFGFLSLGEQEEGRGLYFLKLFAFVCLFLFFLCIIFIKILT